MSLELEAADSLRELVGEQGGVKAALNRAVDATGWDYARLRRVWYRQVRLYADEMDFLRDKLRDARAARKEAKAHAFQERDETFRREIDAVKAELADLRCRMESAGIHAQG